MTIKDVEKTVDLKKANIRYYEEEGLLSPKRDSANNYRNYSMHDVEQLERIKFLRLLGVSVQDIRRLQKQEVDVKTLMKKRRAMLEREEGEIKRWKEMCSRLEQSAVLFSDVDPSVFDLKGGFFFNRKREVMKLDKIYMLEKSYDSIMKGWTVLIFAVVPLQLSVKIVMGKELPDWVTIPYFTVGLMVAVAVWIVRHRIIYYKRKKEVL